VGAGALVAQVMGAIHPGGRVMLFASNQHGTAAFEPAAVCMEEKTLMGRTRLWWPSNRRGSIWFLLAIAMARWT